MSGKRLLSDEKIAEIMRWYYSSVSFKAKAAEYGVSEITLRKYVEREKQRAMPTGTIIGSSITTGFGTTVSIVDAPAAAADACVINVDEDTLEPQPLR